MKSEKSHVTLAIIFANALISALNSNADLKPFAVHGILSEDFEFYQIITYMWLHDGYIHMLLNMFLFYSFGVLLEKMMGHKAFFVFYLVCGIGGALIVSLIGTKIPVIGASISVMGILTGLAWVEPRARLLIAMVIPLKIRVALGIIVTTEILTLIFYPGSMFAHVGHLSGMAVATLVLVVQHYEDLIERFKKS